eukprot:COSAG01_NODE_27240_length_690_cov_3.038917_2_plen_158_part_01
MQRLLVQPPYSVHRCVEHNYALKRNVRRGAEVIGILVCGQNGLYVQRQATQLRGATSERVSAEHMHGSACPGEPVTTEPTVLRGHGTFLRNGAVVASISGPVEYMDRFVTVRPLRSRYVAAVASVGDVVIGRVSEVVLGRAQRWKVDIHSQQHAHLLL